MRPALLFLCLVPFVAGCPAWFAPSTTPGVQEGGPCVADLDCASGLVCECGACRIPGDDDRPPSCEVTLDDACRTPPSPCFRACGDPTPVGEASCVNGRETCSEVDGVLESQCAPDTCWGTPEPGEICDDGEFVCEVSRSPETGLCYTFNCAGEAGDCIEDCASGATFFEACLGGAYQCEYGFPVEDCGECLGPPPYCVESCDNPTVLAEAVCDQAELTFSCGFILDAVRADECGCASGDVLLQSQAQLDAFASETCVIGDLRIQTSGVTDVSLPLLERVSGTFSVSASGNRTARLGALAEAGSFVVQGNPLLVALEAPALRRVGGAFAVSDNPALPTCRAEALLAQLEGDAGPDVVFLENNLDAPGACDPVDGGPVDGGPADGGPVDGGPVDGGAADAGAADAGAPDAGAGDAGAADSGPAGDGGP